MSEKIELEKSSFNIMATNLKEISKNYDLKNRDQLHLVNVMIWLKIALILIDDLGIFEEFKKRLNKFYEEIKK